MKRFSFRHGLLVAAFLAMAGWLVISYVDIRLAARSQNLIDKAHMSYLQQGGSDNEFWRWRAFGLEADVCKAVTG
ncbi:MAG: hypothetical protein M0R02_14525, partial [Bacteroidales bacterium]|nr:hypothetical protein [Bacteroidales bacterium]